MKLKKLLLFFLLATPILFSCNKKKETTDIIAQKPVEQKPAAPEMMQPSSYTETIDWQGEKFLVKIDRQADEDLPIVEQEDKEYFDNKISIYVSLEDGRVFFDKTFTKSDFANFISESYMKKSALLGIVLEEIEQDCLQFAASVGLPDILSDEYIPLIITLSKTGSISIKKDKRLDIDLSLDIEEEGV
ncbi:MAG: DUF4738 domain-containing protein [Prevotella sp.]|nr:DUF4738 domain-containing protein [Prevotella sp.]